MWVGKGDAEAIPIDYLIALPIPTGKSRSFSALFILGDEAMLTQD